MSALIYCIIFFIVLVNKSINSFESTREMEGYSTGYLADCPGSLKPAIISEKSKRRLAITVLGPGAKKVVYRQHQAKGWGAVSESARGREWPFCTEYYYLFCDIAGSGTLVVTAAEGAVEEWTHLHIAKSPYIDFKKKETVFFIAGFLDQPNLSGTIIGGEYVRRGFNVMLIETHTFLTTDFPISVRFMRPLGRFFGQMLADVVESGLDPKRLHMIGISLGGQTVSFIAKSFTNITGLKPARVTGLDPGGPCFRRLGPTLRLDRSDADFVDMVATNMDGYGMAAPVAHVTFYVNGGEYQPSDLYWMPCQGLCSHLKSFFLWWSAVNHPDSFIGIKCTSVQQARNRSCYDNVPMETNVMGNKVDKTKHGIYFVATGYDWPYHLGKEGLKPENEFWSKTLRKLNEVDVLVM